MPDNRTHLTNGALRSSVIDPSRNECMSAQVGPIAQPAQANVVQQYVAVSPNGVSISIPKELYVALVDFMMTRKYPGSITIQFRGGEILGMESVAKKTYRK